MLNTNINNGNESEDDTPFISKKLICRKKIKFNINFNTKNEENNQQNLKKENTNNFHISIPKNIEPNDNSDNISVISDITNLSNEFNAEDDENKNQINDEIDNRVINIIQNYYRDSFGLIESCNQSDYGSNIHSEYTYENSENDSDYISLYNQNSKKNSSSEVSSTTHFSDLKSIHICNQTNEY